MGATPDWLKSQICEYYQNTTEQSYLAHWSGTALSLHLGLADENTPSLDAAMNNANAFLADKARIRAGTRVLDAGCGVGGSALWLARERGARVTGVTLEARQVELATRFAQEQGLSDQVTYLCMDYAATSFPEGSFDAVWNLESLSHAFDVDSYLAHARWLLAPGGRFVCMDPFRGDSGDPAAREAMCEGMVLPNLRSVGEVCAALEKLGFEQIEAMDLRREVTRPAAAARAAAQNGQLQARLERELLGTPDGRAAHRKAAIGTADGIDSGSVVYAYIGATRPATSSL